MEKLVLLLLIVGASLQLKAQNVLGGTQGFIYLKPLGTENINAHLKRGNYVGPHFLGDTLTMKKNYFEKEYVYFKKGVGAYAVEEKVVNKPMIYKAINKVDKYFVDGAKEQPLMTSDFRNRLTTVYDIGIKLIRYDTHAVEKSLRRLKDPLEIEAYLLTIKFN